MSDTERQGNVSDLGKAATGGGAGEPAITPGTHAILDPLRGKPGLSMIALQIVTIIVGYEWFISGITKVVRGGFPAGLAGELAGKSEGVPAWYISLMQNAFIPNAEVFGYVIEVAEVLAGVALIAGPLIWIFAWDRVSDLLRKAILFFTALSAIGTTFLAINLHLANGGSHPWLIPGNAFDEGIDLDSILPAIQIVVAAVNIIFLQRLRRQRPASVAPPATG